MGHLHIQDVHGDHRSAGEGGGGGERGGHLPAISYSFAKQTWREDCSVKTKTILS